MVKKLIIAVETTASMGPYWKTIYSDYLEKIIRCFCGSDLKEKESSTSDFELAMVIFNTRGPSSDFVVTRSGWTRHVDYYLDTLSEMYFSGGGFEKPAIAEGLSEALMMLTGPQNGSQTQENLDVQKHCILVAANDPYPLPTPVYRPSIRNHEGENVELETTNRLSDAETVAKSFAQCAISLSVICPRQLPKLRALYNAGKINPRAADPQVDKEKNPYYLILISENFMEARVALNCLGPTTLYTNQSPVNQPCLGAAPPTVSSETQMIQTGVGMSQNAVRASITSGTDEVMSTLGVPRQVQSGLHQQGESSSTGANMQLSQQTSSDLQSDKSMYVKIWEGDLTGERDGQQILITRLHGYRCSTSSETLAANWPETIKIMRLAPEDHDSIKKHMGKAELLVFRAMRQHVFLVKLLEKKLCAVIKLPSQLLVLSVSDLAKQLLVGKLFHQDIFEPQIVRHLQQMQQQMQPPLQGEQQQLLQLEQQQQQTPQQSQQQQFQHLMQQPQPQQQRQHQKQMQQQQQLQHQIPQQRPQQQFQQQQQMQMQTQPQQQQIPQQRQQQQLRHFQQQPKFPQREQQQMPQLPPIQPHQQQIPQQGQQQQFQLFQQLPQLPQREQKQRQHFQQQPQREQQQLQHFQQQPQREQQQLQHFQQQPQREQKQLQHFQQQQLQQLQQFQQQQLQHFQQQQLQREKQQPQREKQQQQIPQLPQMQPHQQQIPQLPQMQPHEQQQLIPQLPQMQPEEQQQLSFLEQLELLSDGNKSSQGQSSMPPGGFIP